MGTLNNGNKPGALGMAKGLNPQQTTFVSEYLKTSNARQAAVNAGYSAKSANAIMAHQVIKDAISAGRKRIEDEGIYGLKKAMQETEEAMDFARKTKNATALANILQLRAKLNGLVIDKADHRISGSFQINIEGIGVPREVGPALDQALLTTGMGDSDEETGSEATLLE